MWQVLEMIFIALLVGIVIIAIVSGFLISTFAGVQRSLDDEQN
jgi:hypothetical protein